MALKDIWIDKTNSTNGADGDFVNANDINNIARSVIDLEDEPDIVADNVMSDVSENPVQNKVVKKYVDDNVEYIHNSYGGFGDAIGSINMELENLGINVGANSGAIAENGGAISNLTDRILNVETNKVDFNYVSQFIDSYRNESEFKANKGVPNGYAPLDENAQIPDEHISNLSDRILNVETNKADISYVDNAISNAINEALEGDY